MSFYYWCEATLCWLLSGLSLLLPLGRWLPEGNDAFGLFNRYCIRYTAQTRLMGEISYSIGFREVTETFFLEAAAEPVMFCSFIDGFLDGRLAYQAQELTFSPLDGGGGEYCIESVVLEWVKPPQDTRLLLEDAYSQAGVDLRRGGALDSFVWKAAPKGFANLLNRFDEGRLVQQSYYGTGSPPYVSSNYMGTPWCYNPVQGGDQHGNRSKLVHYATRGNEIYIKCRPMDWSKNSELTPSYMENTYTLKDGVLAVDNRFVDFSGYAHPASRQEMPACYVISALDTFYFYGGNAPWTDDALTRKSNLPFWGNNPDAFFYLDLANTETWCIWTQGGQPDAFGLSVYTPGAEILMAGRSGSKITYDANADATNYVAPLRTLQMTAEPFEYTYYLTAGALSQVRGVWLGMQS